jgi:hypothetical protein
MNAIINFIDGKKLYVVGIAGAVYGVLISYSVVPSKPSIWATIGSVGVIGIRSVMSKLIAAVAAGSTPVVLHEGDDSFLAPSQPTSETK